MGVRYVVTGVILLLMQVGCASVRESPTESFRCYFDSRIHQLGRPAIYVDFVQFQGSDGPRVDMYVEVPHTQLHFASNGENKLETEFTVSISVHDRQNRIVDRREFSRRISTTRDLIARYGAGDRSMQSFSLDPGTYEFIVTILDRAIGYRSQIREEVRVTATDPDPVAMSDLLLIRSVRHEEGRRVITPMISSRVLTLTEPFSVFTELYASVDNTEATLQYGLVQNTYNNDFIIDNPFSFRVQRPYHRTGIEVERRDTMFVRDTTLVLRSGANQVFLPYDLNVDRGSYEVFVRLIYDHHGDVAQNTNRSTKFLVHSLDFPYMTDVDQQIEALSYVASTRDLNYMMSGESTEERRRRLNEYWQNVGAWKMSDYYERVRLANELFTTNVEGWKTPMGMVFIVLGEPHLVDCRIGIERTEIWTYYLQDGGMEFVFVRERTADPRSRQAYYWISSIRGGYSAWLNAINFWR